jgi:hypothetical protein
LFKPLSVTYIVALAPGAEVKLTTICVKSVIEVTVPIEAVALDVIEIALPETKPVVLPTVNVCEVAVLAELVVVLAKLDNAGVTLMLLILTSSP